MSASPSKPALRPYDGASLERAALHYAGRYATTRAKLAAYLRRKLQERGWAGDSEAPVDSLVERFAERGYVNDALFAQGRTQSLLRRGYGSRRIEADLRAAGIGDDVARTLRDDIGEAAERSALAFARRRKIGPFAQKPLNPEDNHRDDHRRALAAMVRAGHDVDVARRILGSAAVGQDMAWDDIPGDARWRG